MESTIPENQLYLGTGAWKFKQLKYLCDGEAQVLIFYWFFSWFCKYIKDD